ncbi:uncharacterized protein LOC128125859 [Lactuca sativa]|uniref:non-specific serine/threonine protein kinase n=1 Tax=Lactuca sativa TaxID=4236 RepID=A0A9R1XSS1_LACSA|nr:uncharacterized protein LOC128125859 [Lactuca sativa]XP_023739572.1 uncharacterized protein LOC111887633 [Lactuca sativa]XP_023739573.1 uncharacterized protein LOC128125859 [Lactuca sativa]XP_023739574.1 uncharacterized protein LOC128125859 [Lactuca sativa]XP_042754894.1 uncharacterized protein LOC111887633 [Lactuca sativa]XP_042754895.1 uncharacterized protein LOC111887633 [Lactuca sativa]XP_052624193.1 uncharacterized protein LOC111887633 [Lactuca sativa]XP_052624194.1 uncharacterized p
MTNNQNKKSNCPGDTTESRADTPPVPAVLEIDANRSVAQTLVDNTYPCGHKRVGVLEYTVDIMRYSLKIKPDQNDMEKYRIEFTYDAHVDGSITLYFFEIGGEDLAKKLLQTITVEVKKGLCKKFIHTGDLFDLPLHKRGLTEVYHLAIKTHATSCNSKHGSSSDPKDESTDCVTQSTLAVFEKVKGENQVRVTNQIIWVNGQMHVCHDFVGLCKPMGIDRKDLGNNCLLCLSKSYPGIHRPIGNISLSKKEIGQGRDGTLVFEGTYAGREAAVKRTRIMHRDVANNEIQILKEIDHPNIVRFYGKEDDGRFVYTALERCQCNLRELISSCDESDGFKLKLDGFRDLELWKVNVYPSEHLLEILRDIVKGTAHLHELGIFHMNLNSQNILIHRDTSITTKVSGMGRSKRCLSDNKSSLTESTTSKSSFIVSFMIYDMIDYFTDI